MPKGLSTPPVPAGRGRPPCKPVSVPAQGRAAVIHLERLLPSASSDLPGARTRRAAARPLFGLAPRGVYLAAQVALDAVRSYRTISPLPRNRGGMLSVALAVEAPSREPLPAVSRHAALRRPDFPPRPKAPRLPGRPTLGLSIGPVAGSISPADGRQARIGFTTLAVSTPVSFASKPWCRYVNRSWSMPNRCSRVAWKSRIGTGSLTML